MECYNVTFREPGIRPNPMQASPTTDRSAHTHGAMAETADRIGATASFLCALHCAALPFVLALLPAIGLGFLADHGFEHGFIVFATLLATTMLVRGYRRHRAPHALALLAPGLVLLWLGGFVFDLETWGGWHAALVATGGSAVALAHIVNLRLSLAIRRCCEAQQSAIV